MNKNLSRIICNLCGSSRYCLVYRRPKIEKKLKPLPSSYTISESELEKPDKIVRCMTCGLVFAIPEDPIKELTQDYVNMADPEYLKEERGRRAQADIVLRKIAKFKRSGKLLDIGCGPGFFLDQAKRQGWAVHGVDLSQWSKDHAKAHFNIDITQGLLTDARFPDRAFDVIVMNDVIEHLEDPKCVLKEIRRILKNDGIIYISTPDIQSFLSRLLSAKWWGINKYHLYYFSKKTIEKLFDEVGFKPLRYSSYPRTFSLNYWAMRLRSYPPFIYKPVEFISNIGDLGHCLLKITLHDQIGVASQRRGDLRVGRGAKAEVIAGVERQTRGAQEPARPVEQHRIVLLHGWKVLGGRVLRPEDQRDLLVASESGSHRVRQDHAFRN